MPLAGPLGADRHWRFQSAVVGAGILIGSYDLGAISVTFAPLRTQWHLTNAVVSLLGTATLAGMLLGSLATGFLADRLGRRRLVVADVGLFVVTAAMGAAAPDFAVLAVARLATGLAVGMDFAVVFPFVAETAPRHKRGRAMVWIMWAANFGTLAAYGIGALLLHVFPVTGWRAALAVGGVLALPLLMLRRQLSEPAEWRRSRLPGLRELATAVADRTRRRRLSVFAAATFCYQIGDQGLGLVLPLLLVTVLTTTGATGAVDATAVKAITIPASTLAVVLIERWGRARLQVLGFVGRGLSFLVLGTLLVVVAHLPAPLVGALLAAGYFFGAAGPDKTTVIVPAEVFPSEIRGSAQGISQAAGRLGGIVGVTAYGLLADVAGPGAGLLLFGVAALVGAAVSAAAGSAASMSGSSSSASGPPRIEDDLGRSGAETTSPGASRDMASRGLG